MISFVDILLAFLDRFGIINAARLFLEVIFFVGLSTSSLMLLVFGLLGFKSLESYIGESAYLNSYFPARFCPTPCLFKARDLQTLEILPRLTPRILLASTIELYDFHSPSEPCNRASIAP